MSHAVVNPGAVMVHLEDAAVALAAVVRPVRLHPETALAYSYATVLLALYGEKGSFGWWRLLRISGTPGRRRCLCLDEGLLHLWII